MFERFTKEAKAVVTGAVEEARLSGASSADAEHLLLALAGPRGGSAARALGTVGLDREGVLDALEAERAGSLAAVGIAAPDLPPARPRGSRHVPFGASAKLALERSLSAATARGDRRLGPEHVLLGVLQAREGVVPRALRAAGVSLDEVQAALG